MKARLTIVFSVLILLACKKEKDLAPTQKFTDTDTADFTCKPFSSSECTTNDGSHLLTGCYYNPAKPYQVIYRLVNEEIHIYDRLTKTDKLLADHCFSDFQVNRKGWIVFGKPDGNIYVLQAEGGPAARLTSTGNCFDPKWNYTDTLIMYHQRDKVDQIVKMTYNGKKIDSIPSKGFRECYSKKTDQIAYITILNGAFAVYFMDIATKTETLVMQNHRELASVALDHNDEFLYAADDSSTFRVNILTGFKETILKNCPNYWFKILATPYSSNGVMVWWRKASQLSDNDVCGVQEYRSFLYDPSSKGNKLEEIKVPLKQ